VSYTVLVAVLLTTLSVLSYRLYARQLNEDTTGRLKSLTSGLHRYVRFDGDTPRLSFDTDDADEAAFVNEATRYYQIYDADTGRLVAQSTAIQPLALRLAPEEVHEMRTRLEPFDITTDSGRYRIANSTLRGASGHALLLQVGTSLAPVDQALSRYRVLLLWRVPVALVIAALGAWLTARLALSPVSRLATTTATIDVNNLSQRLPLRGTGDELDTVARAFNEALARLERSVARMRQFSTALAHELRTSLAALRAEIELSLLSAGTDPVKRSALGSQLEELDGLKRLIDQILTLARAEAGQTPVTFAPVDLAGIARAAVEQLEPLAAAREVDLRLESGRTILIEGDSGWLTRLLLNLLDNALKFTPPGGQVTVRVARQQAGARLEVQDTGIGISPDAITQVFEPFFRTDAARASALDGAGLGLTLVKWIADAHHGRVAVDSRPGVGATFTVWLPAFSGAQLH